MTFLRRSAFIGVTLLLLGCVRESGLPPADVLVRAAAANRDLRSADVEATVSFDTTGLPERGMEGTISARGRTQGAGSQIALDILANGTAFGPGGGNHWTAKGSMIVGGEQEMYVRIDDISSDAPQFFLDPASLSGLLGRWWRLPARDDAPSQSVTPDPKFLRMQAEVVDVVRDRGLETIGGRRTYHYDVAINEERMFRFLEEVARERGENADPGQWQALLSSMELTGALWIDAETFFIQAVSWSIVSKDLSHPFSARARMAMSNFNGAEPIGIPQDFAPLGTNPFDGMLPGGSGTFALPPLPGLDLPEPSAVPFDVSSDS